MITVTGYIPIVVIEHSPGSVSKGVPDAQTFSIFSPSSFNLKPASGNVCKNRTNDNEKILT